SSGVPRYSVTPAVSPPPPVNCCKSVSGLVPVSHMIKIKTPATIKPVLEKRYLKINPMAKGENTPPPNEPVLPLRSSTLLLFLLPCHFIWYRIYSHYNCVW